MGCLGNREIEQVDCGGPPLVPLSSAFSSRSAEVSALSIDKLSQSRGYVVQERHLPKRPLGGCTPRSTNPDSKPVALRAHLLPPGDDEWTTE